MDFDKVIEKRHCVHSFKSKKTSWKNALEAIDAAIKGPFAGNINNLKFIIVEEKSKIKELAKHAHQSFVSHTGLVVVVCSDDTHLENQYGERGRVYNKQQSGAAIMTIMLKLTDLGLSTCWVGAFEDELVKTSLGIPEHIQVEAILPIGYGKSEKGPKKRKSELENVLKWDSWKGERRPALFEGHKEEVK
jgi:nitroreductase